jgi:hypothetical protein
MIFLLRISENPMKLQFSEKHNGMSIVITMVSKNSNHRDKKYNPIFLYIIYFISKFVQYCSYHCGGQNEGCFCCEAIACAVGQQKVPECAWAIFRFFFFCLCSKFMSSANFSS